MTENQWNTYIQVNIYGPTLQDLCNRGIFLGSILQEIGCANHWIKEKPLENFEENPEILITDWDREIDGEEVLDSSGQPIFGDSEGPQEQILSTSASEIPRNSTPLGNEDLEIEDPRLDMTASTIHSDDEEDSFFVIEDKNAPTNPNDSLFKSGPLLFIPPECSTPIESTVSNSKEEDSEYTDDDEDEEGFVEDEHGNRIEIELRPNTSQEFFHYDNGNFTPHYTKGCKNRVHWMDLYGNL